MPGVTRDSILLSLDGHALAASTTSFWSDDSGGIHVRLVYERPPGSRLSIRSTIPVRLARGHRQLLSVRRGDNALHLERMLDAGSGDVIIDVSAASPAVGSLIGRFFSARRSPHPHRLRPSVVPRRRAGRPARVAGRDSDDHRIHGRPLTHAAARRHRTPGSPRTHRRTVDCRVDRLRRRRKPGPPYPGLPVEADVRIRAGSWSGLRHGASRSGVTAGGAVALPVAAFNAGVEAGQIAVAALLVPLFWRLSRWPIPQTRFAAIWSVLVALAGSYWLVERIG